MLHIHIPPDRNMLRLLPYRSAIHGKETTMTSRVGEEVEVRPFRIDVPEEDLADLRRRIADTQWPEKETVADEPRACSSPRSKNSRAIGPQITIGAGARRN